jgi:hypothetical protein
MKWLGLRLAAAEIEQINFGANSPSQTERNPCHARLQLCDFTLGVDVSHIFFCGKLRRKFRGKKFASQKCGGKGNFQNHFS